MENEIILALSLFLLTFLLEDAATSSAAILASEGSLPVSWAFIAVLSGIILGDLGLYGLGKLLQKSDWCKSFFNKGFFEKLNKFVTKKVFLSVLLARFVPGMRLVTYTAMGFYNADFKVYSATVFIAVGVWTGFLFFSIYAAGEALEGSEYRVIGLVILFFVGILLPYIIGKIAKRRKRNESAE